MNSDYEMHSRWDVRCSRESLWDALEELLDTDDPMVWWPAVKVTSYDHDDLDLRVASHLGYAVTFRLTDLHADRPGRLTFSADGDLRGTGVVDFVHIDDDSSAMLIDWRVATDSAWMRRTSWLLRPLFVAGHHLVMRQGEKHLNAWVTGR